jgi:hypothetical protein
MSADELDELIADGTIKPEHIECRSEFHHMWERFAGSFRVAKNGDVQLERRCRNGCGNSIVENLAVLNGRIVRIGKPKREYADGYLTKGKGRIAGDARERLRYHSMLPELRALGIVEGAVPPKAPTFVPPKPPAVKKSTPRKGTAKRSEQAS